MWLPNHFLPIAPESSDDDENQTEDGACGDYSNNDVLNDDDNVYDVDACFDDDYADNDNNGIDSNTEDDDAKETSTIISSPVVLHDSDETETDDETHDSDDLTGMCSEGKALPGDTFLPFDEVIDILTCETLGKVHASVPLDRKENVWVLVDNSDNIKRRKGGKKYQYLDDCGAWGNGTKASTPSTMYTKTKRVCHTYCKKRRQILSREAVTWKENIQALEPQPASGDVFTLRRNYSRQAHSNYYVRRLTWLEAAQRRCLYEYRGKCPGAHAHGRSVNPERTGAYIRLQPQVMEKVKEDIRTQKPDKLYREADVVVHGPRKKRIIYDAKHRDRDDGMNTQTARAGTFADQVHTVERMAHAEKFKDFIQVITRAQGKVPTIILHSKEQMADMKRSCSRIVFGCFQVVSGRFRSF